MSHKPELMICANDLGVLSTIFLNFVGECKKQAGLVSAHLEVESKKTAEQLTVRLFKLCK